MKNLFSLCVAVALLVVFATGCQDAPKTEIDAAKTAVDSAKILGADIYLADDFNLLQDSLNAVLESIEKESSKLFGSFSDEQQALSGITQMALKMQEDTKLKIEAVRTEAQTLIEEVKVMNEENKSLLAKAPKGKEGAAALEAIKSDIDAIDSEIIAASDANANGNGMEALNKSKASKDKALTVNTELKDAIAKKTK